MFNRIFNSSRRWTKRDIASAIVVAILSGIVKPAPAADPLPPLRSAASEFNEPVEPLHATRPRSEVDSDRLEAAALFAAGRTLEQQDKMVGALREFERAAQLDPASTTILREILPLAFSLNRQTEAIRYATRLVERDPSDVGLVLQIGRFLTSDGDWKRAFALYDKVLATSDKLPNNGYKVRLWQESARLFYLDKQYAKAAELFAQVVTALDAPEKFSLDDAVKGEIIGEGGFTYQLMGQCFLEAKRPLDAAKAFDSLNKITASRSLHAYHMAQVADARGDTPTALEKLQAYFDTGETTASQNPCELLASLLKKQNKEGELLGHLEKRFAEKPDNLPLATYYAQQLAEAGQHTKAEAIYQHMLAKGPAIEAFDGLAGIYRATKQPEKLLNHLAGVIAILNNLEPLVEDRAKIAADAEVFKALVEAARQKQKHEQEKDAKASLDAETALAVAYLALEAKQYDLCNEFFDLALAAKPRKNAAETMLAWGLGMFAAERYDDAVRILRRAIEEKIIPDEVPVCHYYLSSALEMLGKTDAALDMAREALRRSPTAPRYETRIAWIMYHAKRYEAAENAYQEFVKKHDADYLTDEVRDLVREARSALSNLCAIRHDYAAAEEWLQEVLDEFPDDIGIFNDLGYLWADQNKHLQRSLRMLEIAVAGDPKNHAYRDSLGWVYFRLGRADDALKEILAAADEESPDGEILDHLGEVYRRLNNRSSAIDYWKKSAAAYDKTEQPAKAKTIREKIAAEEAAGGK